MADSLTAAVASQVPFYDFCSLLENISGISGTEKKKKILITFLNSWREVHGKLHGSSKTVEYKFCSVTLNITDGRGWGELSLTSYTCIPIMILWVIYRQYQLRAHCTKSLYRVTWYKKHFAGLAGG